MKKLLIFLLVIILCSVVITSCKSHVYEKISSLDEPYKKIDENGVKDIDFTDCTVEYVSSGCFDIFIYERMSSGNTDDLVKCLQNASLEKTYDFISVEGGGDEKFRITLNDEEVIYIGYDEINNPNIIQINSIRFKCDEDSVKNIKGKIRNYVKQTNGLWYYR